MTETKSDVMMEIALIFLVALLYVLPVLNPSDDVFPAGGDFSMMLSLMAYARDSILEYHQFPTWYNLNPPGVPFITYTGAHNFISMPFILVFGELLGVKILSVLFVFLTGVSMWLFARRVLGVSATGRLFAATSLMLCGMLTSHVFYAGKPHRLITYPLIPAALLFLYLSVERKKFKYVCLSAVSMALFMFSGENYFLQYFLVLFLLFSLFHVFRIQTKPRLGLGFDRGNFRVVSLIFLLFLLFSAVRLIPILELQLYMTKAPGENPDPFQGSEPLDRLLSRFFITEDSFLGFWEHYAFVGYIIPVFLVFSLLSKSKRLPFLYTSLFVFIVWGLGRYSFFSLIIPHLPLVSSLRWVCRTLVFSSFLIISCATIGFEWFFRRGGRGGFDSRVFFLAVSILFLAFGYTHVMLSRYGYISYRNIFPLRILLPPIAVFSVITAYGLKKKGGWNFFLVAVNAASLFMVNGALMHSYPNPLDTPTSGMLKWLKEYDNSTYIIDNMDIDTYYCLLCYPTYKLSLPVYQEWHGMFSIKNVNPLKLNFVKYAFKTKPLTDDAVLVKMFENVSLYAPYYFGGEYRFNYTTTNVYVYLFKDNLPYSFKVDSSDEIKPSNKDVLEASVLSVTPNKILVKTDKREGFDRVVIPMVSYPGWKVSVDGGRTQGALDWNGFVSASLSEGTHIYEFVFDPLSVKIGLLLTLSSVVIMVVGLVWEEKICVKST